MKSQARARRADERCAFDVCQRHSEALRVADEAFRSLTPTSDQDAVLKLRSVARMAAADARATVIWRPAKVARIVRRIAEAVERGAYSARATSPSFARCCQRSSWSIDAALAAGPQGAH